MGASLGCPLAAADAAVQSPPSTFGGPVDGDVKVGFSVIDGNGEGTLQADFYALALVYTTPWPIDIGKPHGDAGDNVAAMIEGIRQTLGDVVAQAFGQIEVIGMDLDMHVTPHLEQGDRIMGVAIDRHKQTIIAHKLENN